MSLLNSELEALGIDGNAYWAQNIQNEAIDKADPINRQGVKAAYTQAMGQLDTILSFGSPTLAQVTAAVTQEAQILKNILLYLKSELQQ